MTSGPRLALASLLAAAACSGGGGGAGNTLDAASDAVIDAPAVIIDAAVDAPTGPVDYQVPTVPLSELLVDTYKSFPGGLYGRSTVPPMAHQVAGRNRAAAIQPRDVQGNPSATGRYVLLSVGMSNATQEWCSASGGLPCAPQSLMAKAAADPMVEHQALALVNGARGGQTCTTWDQAGDANWDRVRGVLSGQGYSEAQVQAIWLKCAEARPTVALPAPNADAYQVERAIGGIVRSARSRYPNLQMIFISDRIYAGYATSDLNPEPYAYETGFGVKWVIEAQLRQRATGAIDPIAGDLGPTVAPWIGWGPDLWAKGATARGDGLAWLPGDYQNDGTHPAASGENKVSALLLAFFKTTPLTRCWFLANQSCAAP